MHRAVTGFVAGLALGAALSWLALAPGVAAAGAQAGGAGPSGSVNETLKYRTLKGNHDTMTFARATFVVPESYGRLIAAAGRELWFVDEKGVVRNALLTTPEGTLVQVDRQP